jgi:hypothetical protein
MYNLTNFINGPTSPNMFVTYLTSNFGTESLENQHVLGKQENSSDYRFQRLQNPIFRYDFKLGNYMPDENKKKKYIFVYNNT